MSYYKLIRQRAEGKAVRGTLNVVHTYFNKRLGKVCERLETLCPTLENADFLVPALIYRVAVTVSPRFHRPLPVLCQVPGRSGIRIHYGTKPTHSLGCVLIPDKKTCEAVVQRFTDEQGTNAPIYLEISEERPGDHKHITIEQSLNILRA